jgi:hypothetical protein
MPTNANAYNSRITDETLEQRFRTTFKSQGGAELVDDLYASGVIVPVVDFTQAAIGSILDQQLQEAWDFSTGHNTISNTTTQFITNPGFWKITANFFFRPSSAAYNASLQIGDGLGFKTLFRIDTPNVGSASNNDIELATTFYVFLRSGDFVQGSTNNAAVNMNVSYRQIADLYGNLNNPLGFVSQ